MYTHTLSTSLQQVWGGGSGDSGASRAGEALMRSLSQVASDSRTPKDSLSDLRFCRFRLEKLVILPLVTPGQGGSQVPSEQKCELS